MTHLVKTVKERLEGELGFLRARQKTLPLPLTSSQKKGEGASRIALLTKKGRGVLGAMLTKDKRLWFRIETERRKRLKQRGEQV